MFIQSFTSGPFATNAYIVACQITGEAAIIDPAPDIAQRVQSFLRLRGWHCKKIILTHSHWDHIASVKAIKDLYDVRVYVHTFDVPNLRTPGVDGIPCWLKIVGVEPDEQVQDGMEIIVGNLILKVLHTPGHSPGSICLYESTQNVLFSGDTLFKGSIGNLSFPTCQPVLMWDSLQKLAQLPQSTEVFPGHGDMTTVGAEISMLHNAQQLFG